MPEAAQPLVPTWLTLANTSAALQQDTKTRDDLTAMLSASGDSRSAEQWLYDDLKEGDTNDYFKSIVLNASLPKAASDAVAQFNSGPSQPNFFTPPAEPVLPPAIQNLIDSFLGQVNNPPPSVAPTPDQLATVTPDIVISPTVNNSYTFAPAITQVIQYITNIFNPEPAPARTSNAQGNAGTISGFLTPTNGAPLYNSAGYGTATSPDTLKQGQVIDGDQSRPTGVPSQIAGMIRGLEIPGLSGIKNDRALIIATLCAPLLGLLALWLVKKFFFRK